MAAAALCFYFYFTFFTCLWSQTLFAKRFSCLVSAEVDVVVKYNKDGSYSMQVSCLYCATIYFTMSSLFKKMSFVAKEMQDGDNCIKVLVTHWLHHIETLVNEEFLTLRFVLPGGRGLVPCDRGGGGRGRSFVPSLFGQRSEVSSQTGDSGQRGPSVLYGGFDMR